MKQIVGACALLALAASAGAQTLRIPTLPERHQLDTSPERKGREWEYSLGAGAGWDSNLDFLIPDGPSEPALLPRGGLSRIF